MLVKTIIEIIGKILVWKKKETEKIHPYQIPRVLKIKIKANEKYLNWLESKVK